MSVDAPGLSLPGSMLRIALAAREGVRVAVSAEVLAYDASEQTARVRVLVEDTHLDAAGARQWEEVPPIDGVPVAHLQAGTVSLWTQPAVGDVGLLLIRDRSHDEVDSGQGAEAQVTPASGRRWSYADAVFLPASVVPGSIGSGGRRGDGSPVLAMGGGLALYVGDSGATDAAARASVVDSNDTALATSLAPIVTAWNAVVGTGGPLIVPAGPALPVPSPTTTASARLKIDG